MPYIKGLLLIAENTPYVPKNNWEYLSNIAPKMNGKLMLPVADAEVNVILSTNFDLVTKGLSSDDGEFYLRVPSGFDYFIEVYSNHKLILMKFLHVEGKREIDVGQLDLLTTAEALLIKKRILNQKHEDPEKILPQIENYWENGLSLTQLIIDDSTMLLPPSSKYDPFHLISSFTTAFDDQGESLLCTWETREPCHASLFYRSFRSRNYHREHFPAFRKKGKFALQHLREFEGYVYYLEVQSRNGLLAQTPVSCFRVPIRPVSKNIRFIGRQDGPVVLSRRKAQGKKTFKIPPVQFEILLQGALEKSIESELCLEFARKIQAPRYIIREGYHELELNVYFPEDHSFMWGPIEETEKSSIQNQTLENIKKLWKKIKIESPPNCIVEIGYSTPFSELVSYQNGNRFRLFSNMNLSDSILILTYRRIDTLDLDSIQYYQGYLTLQGEGLFSDYQIQLEVEGRFEEEKTDDLIVQSSCEICGSIDFVTEMTIAPKRP